MSSDGALAKVTYLPGVARERAEGRAVSQKRAENISMHALTRRGQSRAELEDLLVSRELEPETVEAELDRLERVGLIDDDALAETIVRTQHERKGLGRAALSNELRRRRISPEVIEAAVGRLGDDEELQCAVRLAERRVRQLQGLDRETAARRLSGYLQRKGYNSETVRQAILTTLPKASAGVSFR